MQRPTTYALVIASNGQEAYGCSREFNIEAGKQDALSNLKKFVQEKGVTANWADVRYLVDAPKSERMEAMNDGG